VDLARQSVPTVAANVSRNPQLERAFREHHNLVFQAAYRVTGNAADAEDALQTVFLRLARRTDGVDVAEASPAYLCRAAVNAGLDVLRSRQRADRLGTAGSGGQEATEAAVDPTPGADDRMEVAQLRAALRRALLVLNPRAAEIFALRAFEGWTNPEIARRFGTSQAVIAVTLHRAKKQLRKRLQEDTERSHQA
jgi:RNA polymerase sigma-70 factor, ECF subfamily